ncbi:MULTISPECIES: hypothetical protein [Deinococcus]|uniref:Uncharacterized protein n=1 Tax=Deinococcus rufus TaxID=2136097 RepID=A0ABV7ZAV5_9DEIO|nr:hypothetical protein [Deinococcus sp. AB2017081]WQE97459.1 hypothetical protein U2P90_20095 [Deinococcus sp. AB2017081]WQE97482.1 hypothetical protein U2P90_19965 [Deinococcus sp. AB2017081]
MSPRSATRPLPEVVEFRYRPRLQHLVLFVAYLGRTFPMKIDLKRAGAGLYSYSDQFGTLLLSRGRKGKAASSGATRRDAYHGSLGIFTARRELAERLLSLLWQEPISLELWPPDQDTTPRLIGAALTDTAITFKLDGYTPLRVPRGITGVWLSGWDPTFPAPRVRVLTISVERPEGTQMYEVEVDTGSENGRAALVALGLPGYAPQEEVQPFRLAAA